MGLSVALSGGEGIFENWNPAGGEDREFGLWVRSLGKFSQHPN